MLFSVVSAGYEEKVTLTLFLHFNLSPYTHVIGRNSYNLSMLISIIFCTVAIILMPFSVLRKPILLALVWTKVLPHIHFFPLLLQLRAPGSHPLPNLRKMALLTSAKQWGTSVHLWCFIVWFVFPFNLFINLFVYFSLTRPGGHAYTTYPHELEVGV